MNQFVSQYIFDDNTFFISRHASKYFEDNIILLIYTNLSPILYGIHRPKRTTLFIRKIYHDFSWIWKCVTLIIKKKYWAQLSHSDVTWYNVKGFDEVLHKINKSNNFHFPTNAEIFKRYLVGRNEWSINKSNNMIIMHENKYIFYRFCSNSSS